MCKERLTLGRLAFGSIALTLVLSGCGQITETTAAGRPSGEGTSADQADPLAKPLADLWAPSENAESGDFMQSVDPGARPNGLLGAPTSDAGVESDGESPVPSAPAPNSTEGEEEPPAALAFAADEDDAEDSTSTTRAPAATATTSSSNPTTTARTPNSSAPSSTSASTSAPTSAPATTKTPANSAPAASTPTTATPTTATPTTTTAAPATTTSTTQAVSTAPGRYTIAQVIDGTISAGDGSNPNEEAPMGRHDAPLSLNQGWNWATGPTRNSVWGELGTGGSQYAEFRCAVIPESGHTPSVPFRVNVREGAYYQFVNDNWQKAFDVDLTGGNHGGYLGTAGETNGNPFDSGSHGLIEWRREADGSFSAPWNPDALMMHFWASQRQAPAPGQTAEFLTSEFRIQQPDGQTVDLSQVRVLFQCGVDYYAVTTGQGTQVPGPGIGKYHRLTTQWEPSLWVTLPRDTPANSVADFRTWLEANLPPNVSR